MSVGTAVAVGLGISAAGSVASAAIGAHAAHTAANQQAASADKALNVGQQVYQNQLQAQAPYQQAGSQALGRLGALGAGGFNPANYNHGVPNGNVQGGMPPPGGPGGGMPSQLGGAPAASPLASATPIAGAQMGSGPNQQMVTIQAPTGETKQLPLAQAQAIVAASKGQAKILG